jgi:hypothetical protein
MLKLDRPGYGADETFTACISRVRNPGLKERLTAVTQWIADESAAFGSAAQNGVLHHFPRTVLPNVSTEEMERVYTSRMAKENAPGRAIYDDIFEAALRRLTIIFQRHSSRLWPWLRSIWFQRVVTATRPRAGAFPTSRKR